MKFGHLILITYTYMTGVTIGFMISGAYEV